MCMWSLSSYGGRHTILGSTTVVNVSNYDYEGSPANVYEILIQGDKVEVKTHSVYTSVREINGVGWKREQYLREYGYTSIQDIVNIGIEELMMVHGINYNAAYKIRTRAMSLVQQRVIPFTDHIEGIPDRENLFYFDVETDIAPPSLVWAISVMTPKGEVIQWYARTLNHIENILENFAEWVLEQIKLNPEVILGYWSGTNYDLKALEACTLNFNAPTLEKVLRKVQNIDLLPLIRRNFAVPSASYGLKEIGSLFGYNFNKELDGLIVASEYLNSQEKGGLPDEREKEFLEYNKDDVLSLELILQNTIYLKQSE
ncbi:MAG: ribonuclease H-like domain-containing protein [Candidatus Heimdallarchaeaceae archaeon]